MEQFIKEQRPVSSISIVVSEDEETLEHLYRKKYSQSNSQSLDQELDMATNSVGSDADSKKVNANGGSHSSPSNSVHNLESPKSKLDELVEQERRTRIAFLENQQAELETEIRLLKQNGKSSNHVIDIDNTVNELAENGGAKKHVTLDLCANSNQQDTVIVGEPLLPVRDRLSSGMGDSLESNPELDALSRMVVDRVLDKIKADGNIPVNNNTYKAVIQNTRQQQSNLKPGDISKLHWVSAVLETLCTLDEDKSGVAVTQMRYLLQRERNLVSELQVGQHYQRNPSDLISNIGFQAAISTERLKALEWMERHNREKEAYRELQVPVLLEHCHQCQ